jgi:hypothetical protein
MCSQFTILWGDLKLLEASEATNLGVRASIQLKSMDSFQNK